VTSTPPPDPTTLDAREFGRHVLSGGWRLGLLVARNVSQRGRGRPPAVPAVAPGTPTHAKVTASEFARRSKVSRQTVDLYLKAWNAAAADHVVPPADELHPGATSSIPHDPDAPQRWLVYYRRARAATGATAPGPSPSSSSPAPSLPAPSPPARTPSGPDATDAGVLARITDIVKINQRAVAEMSALLDETDIDLTAAVARSPLTASTLRGQVEELRQRLPELHQRLEALSDKLDTSVPIPAAAPE